MESMFLDLFCGIQFATGSHYQRPSAKSFWESSDIVEMETKMNAPWLQLEDIGSVWLVCRIVSLYNVCRGEDEHGLLLSPTLGFESH